MMAKILKQDNDEVRNHFDTLTLEISALKEVISKGESSAGSADWSRHISRSKAAVEGSRSDEVSPDNVQFLSDGYDLNRLVTRGVHGVRSHPPTGSKGPHFDTRYPSLGVPSVK